MDIMPEIPQRSVRETLKMTLREFAELTGLGLSTIQTFELGEATRKTAQKISTATGISVEWLLSPKGEPVTTDGKPWNFDAYLDQRKRNLISSGDFSAEAISEVFKERLSRAFPLLPHTMIVAETIAFIDKIEKRCEEAKARAEEIARLEARLDKLKTE